MKIIELLIDELEELTGFDAVALVNQPAHEANFMAFNQDKVEDALAYQTILAAVKDQFVTRLPGESKDDYMGRCIPKLKSEGYADDQAIAICLDTFKFDSDSKKKFERIEVDGLPLFSSKEEAELYATEIGCEGSHVHQHEGQDWYMPCSEHSDLTDKLLEDYEFESFADYPQSATNAAKRALEWRDSHPDNDCGTRVGWARANQLANRRPISEETISRMASFARHLQHEDVPYSEGCGGLMVDAWGGRAGIEWAQRKLKEIREEQSQEFNHFDNLTDTTQEKLLETLADKGFSYKDLLEDYEILDKPKDIFGLPNKSSANPDGYTSETYGNYKVLYQYTGPKDSRNRAFCKRLLDLDLLFRKEDIQKMSVTGANQEFGVYNIMEFKGSYGCRHRWNKKYVYAKNQVGLLEVAALTLDQAARNQREATSTTKNFNTQEYKFSVDEDKQIVVGPLMIPEKLIFRVDDDNTPYYVFFSKDTIKAIAEKMMKNKLLDKINIEHSQDDEVQGHMLESWIVEDRDKDKQQVYGMDYPEGSWLGAYKVEDPGVWQMVKDGILKAFSIEGYFADKLVQR